MKYALHLDNTGRILSATFERFAPAGSVLVDTLPTGETEAEQDVHNYLYQDGGYIYDPLPDFAAEEDAPTQLDRIEAQLTYTAMMTDTLLEV